ncbi:MAG: MurR/RpiR family transcriptional regulator [Synergistales bacterium]|nr:MurR/RpiR family transcriptional regulator [Synergistales bacterium]
MNSLELQTLLRSKMGKMPNKARKVVDYILSHMREAAFMSIGEVAQHLEVSKAQLVRVSRMLGFSGYSELKSALKDAVLEQVNPAAMFEKVMKDQKDLPETIYRIEHANLDDTWKQLTPDKAMLFCDMIKEAKDIYCVGWGISALVVESLYTRLMEMGLKGVLMKRGSVALIEQARAVKEGDLVIVCELPSYVIEVTESIQKSKENQARVITLTDSPAAPICQYADLSFYVSDKSPTFGSSIIAPLFLIHILTSILAVNLGEKAAAALKDQLEGLHDERIYYPSYDLRY